MNGTQPSNGGTETRTSTPEPTGKAGIFGRRATPEELSRVFDTFFFEGDRRLPYLQQYFVLMVLSATIAAFGLVNDSAAVVIGAMLVAPLMTPILATAASVGQGWGRRMLDSRAIVGAGAACAIGVGILVSFVTPVLRTDLPLPGELLARTSPNMIDLGIAIAAGAAGGFVAVRPAASGALPGVGIAVALVPPLATVGLSAGVGEWDLAIGALLLFVTNLVAIILAAGLVFVGAGFGAYRDVGGARNAKLASVVIVVGIIIVGIPLAVHSIQRLEQDDAIAATASEVREWAPDLKLTRVTVDRSTDPVRVTVGLTGVETPPDPELLAGLLAQDLRRAVDVDIVFVPLESGSAPAP
jgi:uncharacterized hydrophobic protein (TIGR00271 family)